jgi:HK97 family phage prohead protease
MELATRAYSAFEVKAIDSARRTFSGWATTPTVDRVGDSINPLGVKFKNPLSLLHGHRHDLPIGTALFKTPTKRGVEFDAEIPNVGDEYGSLGERVDTAWGELKFGLVRTVSIGFRPIKYAFTDDGVDFQEIEVFELSIVAIPALPEAVITSVKSMDGRPLPRRIVEMVKSADTRGAVALLSSRDLHLTKGAVALK